jgi:hypothetical protein
MHEEAGTFTLLPGARGFHGLFGARADPVRYRAVRAVIGLHMRRHLRYFTPVFSVAFETQKFWHFSYLQVLKLTSPHTVTLERDREYGREVAQISPHIQADQSAHRAVSHRGSARSKRAMAERSGDTKNAKRLERDREYGREVAQISPHIQADQSAHRSVSHRGSARSKRAMVASGGG